MLESDHVASRDRRSELKFLQIDTAHRTVRLLRRIRGSVFYFGGQEPMPISAAVSTAQTAATAGADFILDAMEGFPARERAAEFAAVFQLLEGRYRGYDIYATHKQAESSYEQLPSIIELYQTLVAQTELTPEDRRIAQGSDNMRALPGVEFLNPQMGILSPLSTDYFCAMLYQRLIQRRQPTSCFQLKPLLLSPGLDLGTPPGGQRDEEFARSINEIAVWIDLDYTGATRRAALRAALEFYPDKLVHGVIPAQAGKT